MGLINVMIENPQSQINYDLEMDIEWVKLMMIGVIGERRSEV